MQQKGILMKDKSKKCNPLKVEKVAVSSILLTKQTRKAGLYFQAIKGST